MNIKKQILSWLIIFFIVIIGCKQSRDVGKSGPWRFKYNDSGQLASIIRPDNQTINYQYNEQGKLSLEKYGKVENQFKYNRLGFLDRIIDNTGETILDRDAWGRLKKMVYPHGDELNYDYYENGNILKITL